MLMQLQVIGRLGQDAKIISYQGNEFVSFSIAVNKKYKNRDGNTVSDTIWVNCSMQKGSNIFQYLTKGSNVFIQGEMSVKVYENKDRQIIPQINVSIWKIELLGSHYEPGEEPRRNVQETPEHKKPENSRWMDEKDDDNHRQHYNTDVDYSKERSFDGHSSNEKRVQQMPDPNDDLPF